MNDYFFNCKHEFVELKTAVIDYMNQSNLVWNSRFDIDVSGISRDFFKPFKEIDSLMEEFSCKRQGIFRFHPNTCYGWHTDNKSRLCALNMLIKGTDSHTFFGTPASDQGDDYLNISEVPYYDNRFTLLDVTKHHTVYNLSDIRYLLTISFPVSDTGDFNKVKEYLTKNNF
jgi:hypothetical protein